jgi:membrane fusion protein, multidrug efflux system
MRRYPIVYIAAAVAAAACGPDVGAHDASDALPLPLPLVAAEPGALPVSIHAAAPAELDTWASVAPAAAHVAVLYSELDAEVGPRMDGVIRSVHADLGDAVQAGQLLAQLDDARQVARVASASATRDMARAEYERMNGLLQGGFVTTAQHEEALYRMRIADAALQEAQVELQHTRVVAPFAGVVTRRMAGAGRSVEEGRPLFRVTALRPLRALVRVPERDARAIRAGSRATLTADGGEDVGAAVIRVSPAVDPGSGTVELMLNVPEPGPLRPGSGATVRFQPQQVPQQVPQQTPQQRR